MLLVIITFGALAKLDAYVSKHSKVLDLYVELDSLKHASDFLKQVRDMEVKVENFEINKTKIKNDYITALLTIELSHSYIREEILLNCREIEGVIFIEEI